VAVLALSVAAMAGVAGRAAASGGESHSARRTQAVKTYVVRPGDTLWRIAQRLAGRAADPRPFVDAIAALNHSTGVVVPGQSLRLPTAA